MNKPIFFAPIQGYTDSAFREAHNRVFGGITEYYTPFIRLEKHEIRKHDLKEISDERNEQLKQEGKIIPQILPANSEEMKILVDNIANFGYKDIDLNFGCPFPLITKKNKGCGLLPHPETIKEILSVVSQYPDFKFSIKMRLGLETNEEWKESIEAINETRLKHVTIHPRNGKQQYKGDIDFNSFSDFLSAIKHPVIYNGDIRSIAQVQEIEEKYPNISAIMIGRGFLCNPALSAEIQSGKEFGQDKKAVLIQQFHDTLVEKYNEQLDGGDSQLLLKLMTLWEYLLPELDKKSRKKITKSHTLQDYLRNTSEAFITLAKVD